MSGRKIDRLAVVRELVTWEDVEGLEPNLGGFLG